MGLHPYASQKMGNMSMEIALASTMSYSCNHCYKYQKNPIRDVWEAARLSLGGYCRFPIFFIRIEERYRIGVWISTETSYFRGICLASNVFALEQEVP
jgi:hypothetical protein